MPTPDEHLKVLRDLAKTCDSVAGWLQTPDVYESADVAANMIIRRDIDVHKRRAEALRWVLEINAYGVTEDEVVG